MAATADGGRRQASSSARPPAHRGEPALAQGVPARLVMEMLGHSQISLTLGT